MKVALLAPYPASAVLNESRIKKTHRGRPVHPAPWVRSLTTALAKRGDVEFCVFAHSRAVSRVEYGEENGVRFIFIPQYEPGKIGCLHGHFPARIQFRKVLKEYSPDVAHGFGLESAYGLIAAECKVPSVVFIQGIQSEYAPYYDMSALQISLRVKLERQAVNKLDALVAETEYAKKWAHSINPTIRVKVIPHAVNPEFFKVQPSWSSKDCLTVGSLTRRKAVDVSIRAFALLKDKEARLIVIGHGESEQLLRKLATEQGVGERIIFTGHQDRAGITKWMTHARMLIITSRVDTSPNILTEAHAAGLPVVGTRAGGILDMIDEAEDGFLVDIDDHETLTQRVDVLLGDQDQASEMGLKGREKVRWLNDADRIAEEHVELYRQLANSVG